MQAKALRRYRKPRYPTALDVSTDPDLLLKNLPRAWAQHALISSSLTAFLAASGCKSARDEVLTPQPPQLACIAPIFQHGKGRGTTGCVVMSPPIFLSEEEALQIISEELRESGLEITSRNVSLGRIELEHTKAWLRVVPDSPPTYGRDFHADLQDDKRRVVVEYMSERDHGKWGSPLSIGGTVTSYDMPGAASRIAKAIQDKKLRIFYGSFYDPLVSVDWQKLPGPDFRKQLAEAKRRAELSSKELLRQQVKDFVDWLKGQGVI